ncbi:hypothetical protein Tsubulata_009597 [Turnera subulata]|uniref:Beta-amylase n=1 Tax=Turnera subulata TaxID=218843 RepID=A0A9Q0F3R0_9ROSI|nr:hypothetical protein Tsubulata_009597 [Turnera subulata]
MNMELSSVIGCSQANNIICGSKLLAYKGEELRFCVPPGNKANSVSFFRRNTRWPNSSGLRFSLNVTAQSQPQPIRSDNPSARNPTRRSKKVDGLRLFVGLPLDAVSDCNTINHARAIAAGLRALKLLGIEGVELPIWWGVVEKEEMGKYEWSGYLALAEMVHNAGLKLHVSLCFHGNKQPKIPLPEWVLRIREAEPDIFYADRSGQRYTDCLSVAVDELPVLNGKTPVQVYQEFCESFKSSFSQYMGTTVTGVTMGLGPDGELRYPSHHQPVKSGKVFGAGEFQCYDKNMLGLLKKHAEATGNPFWGLGGPHDAPAYGQLPNTSSFFNDNGGSWESPYGDFFLSWYSSQLLSHADRILSLASTSFGDSSVAAYGKIPLMHSWSKMRSHPSELTAGFHNTENNDGYGAVAEMFARNSCKMILPGMDLSDEHQPEGSLSSPESVLAQIRAACREHGVEVSGENLVMSKASHGLEQIKKNTAGENMVDLFTYQRMGAAFFSPDHFRSFTAFVRSLNQLELHSDDLPEEEEMAQTSSESSIMQAA